MLAEDTARLTLLVNGKWGGFFGLGAAQREMHDLGTRLHESMASGLKGKAILASDLGIGIGGLAASAIAGTAVVASSFQTMTQKIQGNTGITNAQLAQVRQEILKLGSEGSVSLTDLGGAFQQASNEGYRGAAAMNVVKTAWKAAIATGGNAKDITSTLTLVLKDFGISAMHAGRAMAIMMRAAASGDTTLPDVAAHFYKVSVMASGIHMPLATAAASFSELTRATHNAGIAQTYWSGMITHMLNPTKQATTLMEGLKQATGIDLQSAFQKFANGQMSFTNVMALARKATEGNTAVIYKLFGGIRGGIGAVKLLGNGWHDYLSIANQTAHSNNLLQHGFSAMQGTISYQMDTLKNKVQVAAVTMGTAFLPMLVQLAKQMMPVVSAIAGFVEHNQALIKSILMVAIGIGGVSVAVRIAMGVLGPLSGIVGLVGKAASAASLDVRLLALAQGDLDVALDANPIGVVVVALAALAAGAYELYQHWKPFRNLVQNTMLVLGRFADWIKSKAIAALDLLQSHIGDVTGWIKAHWTDILLVLLTGPIGLFLVFLRNFGPQILSLMGNALAQVGGWLQGTWMGSLLNWIKAPFLSAIHWIQGFGQTIIQDLVNGLKAAYNLLPGPIKALVGDIAGPIKNLASWSYTAGKNVAQNLANGIRSGAGDVSSAIGSAFGSASGVNQSGLNARSQALDIALANREGGANAPTSIKASFPLVAQYWSQISAGAKQNGLNPYVLASLMAQESSGDINAQATYNQGEHAWDYGLFQYGPPEAASVGGAYGPHISAASQIATAAAYLAKVGLNAWNGPKEAGDVMARANAWVGGGLNPPPGSSIANLPSAGGGQSNQIPLSGPLSGGAGLSDLLNPSSAAAKKSKTLTAKQIAHDALLAALAPFKDAIKNETMLRGAAAWTWKGVNPLTLPTQGNSGLNQHAWLQAQYHSNELLREIKDQTARMALINGQINRAQYDQIKRLDNIAKNTANEAAHHKLHPGFGGAAGHVVPVRMVEHCAAEEKANVHRRKSADSGEKTAKHTQVTNDKLDRVIQRLESLAVALMHHDPKAQFNLLEELRAAGVHPALAHGH